MKTFLTDTNMSPYVLSKKESHLFKANGSIGERHEKGHCTMGCFILSPCEERERKHCFWARWSTLSCINFPTALTMDFPDSGAIRTTFLLRIHSIL